MSKWSILAIDTGQTTGWAHSGGTYGAEHFEKRPWRHPFAHYLDFRHWLLSMIDALEVGRLAYEGTLAGRGFGHGTRAEWQGIIHAVAAERDLPTVCVFPSQLKKYITGDGRAEKPAMLAAVAERFGIHFRPEEHDAAEAVCVLSWATWKAGQGEFEREWSGNPPSVFGRTQICNRCQSITLGGTECPVCGSIHLRWGANANE